MYPARDFEELTGFTGISFTYAMPHDEEPIGLRQAITDYINANNWSCYTAEATARDNLTNRMKRAVRSPLEKDALKELLQEHVRDILTLNPDLYSIKFSLDNIPDLYDFIVCVTSELHPDDIQHCIDTHDNNGPLDLSEQQRELYERIQAFWPEQTFSLWNMSPQTIERISAQIDAYVLSLDLDSANQHTIPV